MALETVLSPVDNFGTVVGENPTPYGMLALWAVNGLSIVYWVFHLFITHSLHFRLLCYILSPWVIKNSCTRWGSRKWHHNKNKAQTYLYKCKHPSCTRDYRNCPALSFCPAIVRGGPQLSSFSLMIIPIITFRPSSPLPPTISPSFFTGMELKRKPI